MTSIEGFSLLLALLVKCSDFWLLHRGHQFTLRLCYQVFDSVYLSSPGQTCSRRGCHTSRKRCRRSYTDDTYWTSEIMQSLIKSYNAHRGPSHSSGSFKFTLLTTKWQLPWPRHGVYHFTSVYLWSATPRIFVFSLISPFLGINRRPCLIIIRFLWRKSPLCDSCLDFIRWTDFGTLDSPTPDPAVYYHLHQSCRLRPRPKQSCVVTMIDLLQTIYELWILEIFWIIS